MSISQADLSAAAADLLCFFEGKANSIAQLFQVMGSAMGMYTALVYAATHSPQTNVSSYAHQCTTLVLAKMT